MHTTVETVHQEDVQAVIRLMYEVLLSLKGDEDFRYIK
jgi:putative aminopeptidase FrvX